MAFSVSHLTLSSALRVEWRMCLYKKDHAEIGGNMYWKSLSAVGNHMLFHEVRMRELDLQWYNLYGDTVSSKVNLRVKVGGCRLLEETDRDDAIYAGEFPAWMMELMVTTPAELESLEKLMWGESYGVQFQMQCVSWLWREMNMDFER